MTIEKFSYDAVKYPTLVFPHIRPDRIAAIAAMHGIETGDIASWRILEVGCGDGANLLSIAHSMPGSKCVGIDLSKERINEANAVAIELGLSNIEFHFMDVGDFDPARFEKFDLIIAHGFYSWVPSDVRAKLMSICSDTLKPDGIAFISYNTLPGWHLHNVFRDAVRFHTRDHGDEDADAKVTEGLQFFELLAESASGNMLYQRLLQSELKLATDRNLSGLYHDEMATLNDAFYITTFADHAAKFEMKWFTEAEPGSVADSRIPAKYLEFLEQFAATPVIREQYIDLLSCRRFRSSLICHANMETRYVSNPERLTKLWLASRCDPADPAADLNTVSAVKFVDVSGSTFDINHPLTKTALAMLGRSWPRRMPFDEMLTRAQQLTGDDSEEGAKLLEGFILQLINSTVVEPYAMAVPCVSEISERPVASAFARWQIRSGLGQVNGMNGNAYSFTDDVHLELLLKLDGSKTVAELSGEMKDELGDRADELVEEALRNYLASTLLVN